MSHSVQRAIQLHSRGKLDRAGEACAARPKNFEATYRLAVLRYQQGLYAEALDHFGAALELKPGDVATLANFGFTLATLGHTERALASYDKALAIDPDHLETLYNRGNALRAVKRPEDALPCFDRVLAIKPRFADAHINRGNVLLDLGRPEAAVESYDRALAINPRSAGASFNRGNVLKTLGKTAEALASYDKALLIDPNYAEGHIARGDLLRDLDRPEKALASYDRALAIRPRYAEAHDRRGLALMDIGRLAEARRAHERAIELAPKKAAFYYNLTEVARLTPVDPHLRSIDELSRNMAALDWEEQVALHFALAKTFADDGDHQSSFRHLLDGNAVKRRHTFYDEPATLQDFSNLRMLFSEARMRANEGIGEPSRAPVFVLGMPRSGSTLVDQILASHPKVFAAGEIVDLVNAAMEFGGPQLERLRLADGDPDLSRHPLREIGASYLARVRRRAPAAERIVNKTPDNFRLAGLIHLALPNARIIHACRDPRDTSLSCFSLLFSGALEFTYDLGELGRYYRAYLALMAHWREVLPPGVMIEVQYEEVVRNLEGEARRIIAHCGLEWDDACLSFYKTERSVLTASAAQVRRPIYQSSIGRWRRHEDALAPLLRELGPV